MECKHLYVIRDPCRSLRSLRSHRIRRTRNSWTKITRSRRQRNGRNVRFIEREKTRCLWNVLPYPPVPDASRRAPLKKMTLCSRRALEKGRRVRNGRGKKKEKAIISLSSLIATRRVTADREKSFLISWRPIFPTLPLFSDYSPPRRRFHSMSIGVYSALSLGRLETPACKNLRYFAWSLRIIQLRKIPTVQFFLTYLLYNYINLKSAIDYVFYM